MMKPTITIAVPAYSRPDELEELILSVLKAEPLPNELLICEDKSPRRDEIRAVIDKYKQSFDVTECSLKYIENKINLGYDGNIKNLFQMAASDYVLILGDDDVVFSNAISESVRFIEMHPDVKFISRTFSRFSGSPENIINTTWITKEDHVFDSNNSIVNIVFRLCGFVGGLIINRKWAVGKECSNYDGSLYYQFYLACLAYYGGGIGYISESIVGGRAGNPPLFGSSEHEKGVHIPGSYQPKGRARMWAGLIHISQDVEKITGEPIAAAIKAEIAGRQSFHIFEMMPIQGRKATIELLLELKKLGLTNKLLPWLLTAYILIFGKSARLGFLLFRRLQFKIEGGLGLKI